MIMRQEVGKKERLRADASDEWSESVKWSNYEYVAKSPPRGVNTRAGSDDPDFSLTSADKKELTLVDYTGTIVEFLDDLVGVSQDHLRHRVDLERQKDAASEFERNCRPGALSRDVDFSENYKVFDAQQVQSNYWNIPSVTLFISLIRYLEPAAWDCEGDNETENGAIQVKTNLTELNDFRCFFR